MGDSNETAVQPSLEGTIDLWPEAPEGGWQRVLLKLSGEVMAGGQGLGVDPDTVQDIARQIAEVVATGVQVAVVIGGGNYFRGAQLSERGMERTRAAYAGTYVHGLAGDIALKKFGVRGILATDIQEFLPQALIQIANGTGG